MGARQMPEEQQITDFFEGRMRGEVAYVEAAIREPASRAFDVAQLRGADDDAFQTAVDDRPR